jgi:tRNA 2-selenouridine synthase
LVQKITIEQFLELAKSNPVLDVRSPGEYLHAHIPGAYSLPLFTDEERKVVGTAYKQQSRQTAIKTGLDYFGVKMRKMVEEAEALMVEYKSINSLQHASNPPLGDGGVLIHCWRGGMRSAGVAWLLDLYGLKVYTLVGGYKVYRKWVRDQFEKPYHLTVLGGYTGSGKTEVLHQLKREGVQIVDLERIAHHKGSAFGALGETKQPTQEMFENMLAQELNNLKRLISVNAFIEDESQRIGLLKIPDPFWATMRNSVICFLEVPFEERLDYLTAEYGKYAKEQLVNAIIRIQKRLGGLETKTAIGYLVEDNCKECFRILLKYYDKWYAKGLYNRDNINKLLNKISYDKIDVDNITNLVKAQQQKIPTRLIE